MAKLAQDIAENGIKDAVKYIEFKGTKYLVDGHHRLAAAKELLIKEIPAEVVKLPYN